MSTIAAQTNGNGLIELFCTDASGAVYHRWELTHYSGNYAPWTYFAALSSQPSTITATTEAAGAVVVAAVAVKVGFLAQYQIDRFMAFTNPALDPRGAGYNTEQARIAIGNGGIFGQGLFNGSQG